MRFFRRFLLPILIGYWYLEASDTEKENKALKSKIVQAQNRLSELDTIIQKLFEEKCAGNMSDAIFKKLLEKQFEIEYE